jgi:secondary thiamine-phosphate synthase enzyme
MTAVYVLHKKTPTKLLHTPVRILDVGRSSSLDFFLLDFFLILCIVVAMKSYREILTIHVPQRMDFVNITPKVAAAVQKSGVKEGLVLVNSMHITSSVFINDDESGLHQDYKKWLEHLAPFDASPQRYAHNRTGEDNGDAHHKRQIMGREVVVAITEGKLDLGTWEQIFYGEFRRSPCQASTRENYRGIKYGYKTEEGEWRVSQ